MTLPFQEHPFSHHKAVVYPWECWCEFLVADVLPHTNQLGLVKRRWNLETSWVVVKFPSPYLINIQKPWLCCTFESDMDLIIESRILINLFIGLYKTDYSSCKQYGKHYRILPKNYKSETCSGRTDLCREVSIQGCIYTKMINSFILIVIFLITSCPGFHDVQQQL